MDSEREANLLQLLGAANERIAELEAAYAALAIYAPHPTPTMRVVLPARSDIPQAFLKD